MNKSDIITYGKIMMTLRLHPEVYNKMRDKVNKEKDYVRGYSMNQYMTELIMKDLKMDK